MKHHGAGLRRLTGDEVLVAKLLENWREAELSDADRAMLDYADKLAGDFKLQGSLIAMGSAAAFFVLVRRGAIFIRRPKPAPAPTAAPES